MSSIIQIAIGAQRINFLILKVQGRNNILLRTDLKTKRFTKTIPDFQRKNI